MVRRHRHGRVVRQHGPALRPPARHAAQRRRRTSSTASSTPRTASAIAGIIEAAVARRHGVRVRPARRAARTGASAGCTPAPARCSPTRTAAPSASSACSPTSPSAATARRRARSSTPRSQVLAGVDGPGAHARGGRAARRPARWPTGARCSSRPTRPAPSSRSPSPTSTPRRSRWARELQERYPPDPDSPTGAPAVIRSGRSELYPVIDQRAAGGGRARRGADPARARAADALGDGRPADRARAHARRDHVRVGGVRAPATRRRELELAEELGRRAGLALDHARLFAREHRTAETAPARAAARPRCPSCPATSSSSATCPATRATTPAATGTTRSALPDGRVGIVIGDVGGRGMEAAATMGQIRNALRAYALKGAGPGRGDRRPARARRRRRAARSRSSPSSTSCSTRPPARASSRSPATCRR